MTPANRERATAASVGERTVTASARERAATGAMILWMTGILAWHAVRLLQAFLNAHGDALQSALRRLLGG